MGLGHSLELAALAGLLAAPPCAWPQTVTQAPGRAARRNDGAPTAEGARASDGDPAGHVAAAHTTPAGRLTADLAAGRSVLGDIHFRPSSDEFTPASLPVVRRLAKAINATSGSYLIEGHVTASGDSARDFLLSERRAAAVKAQLVLDGVPPARVVAVGYGSSRPLAGVPVGQSARIEIMRAR